MEHLDQRMPTSPINEENEIITRQEVKDQQRRRQKQDNFDPSLNHSNQQLNAGGLSSVSKEEKERRRRSADPSIQGEHSTSAIARQQAYEDTRERQKKADKRRSLAEPPISTSPLSSSPLRNSAGPGGFSQKLSSGAVSRGQTVQEIHSSADAIPNNGSSSKRKSRGNPSASGRNDSDIADGSFGTPNSPSVLNATIHPLLSEVIEKKLFLQTNSKIKILCNLRNKINIFLHIALLTCSCKEDIVIGESAIMMP